jgi:hypothetical protein
VPVQLWSPSVTVTLPLGTIPLASTRNPTVTTVPSVEGSGESLVIVVVVGAALTSIEIDVAPANPGAVNTSTRAPSAPLIAKSVKVARPLASVTRCRVPSSSPPPPDSCAVTVMPGVAALPPAASRT